MIDGATYVHTNLIARDVARRVRFYSQTFGCELVPPERNYEGAALDAGTGLEGARLRGMHLRLPGGGADGPTLEIFQYGEPAPTLWPEVNRPGFCHIAFSVGSVEDARAEVLANGGEVVGEIVDLETFDGRTVTWCYVRDPEANIIELQAWS